MVDLIRSANNDDVAELASLVSSLSYFYLQAGNDTLPTWFTKTLTPNAFKHRIESFEYNNYVYQKNGNHLYHLFVLNEYQNQGIAKQLWEHILNQHPSQQYTLRSSIYAIPVYQQFGFVKSGQTQSKEGIDYQTMVFNK